MMINIPSPEINTGHNTHNSSPNNSSTINLATQFSTPMASNSSRFSGNVDSASSTVDSSMLSAPSNPFLSTSHQNMNSHGSFKPSTIRNVTNSNNPGQSHEYKSLQIELMKPSHSTSGSSPSSPSKPSTIRQILLNSSSKSSLAQVKHQHAECAASRSFSSSSSPSSKNQLNRYITEVDSSTNLTYDYASTVYYLSREFALHGNLGVAALHRFESSGLLNFATSTFTENVAKVASKLSSRAMLTIQNRDSNYTPNINDTCADNTSCKNYNTSLKSKNEQTNNGKRRINYLDAIPTSFTSDDYNHDSDSYPSPPGLFCPTPTASVDSLLSLSNSEHSTSRQFLASALARLYTNHPYTSNEHTTNANVRKRMREYMSHSHSNTNNPEYFASETHSSSNNKKIAHDEKVKRPRTTKPYKATKKICRACGTTNSSYWREPWNGACLCNACGLRYKKRYLACTSCFYVPFKDDEVTGSCPKCRVGVFKRHELTRRDRQTMKHQSPTVKKKLSNIDNNQYSNLSSNVNVGNKDVNDSLTLNESASSDIPSTPSSVPSSSSSLVLSLSISPNNDDM